MKLVKAKFSTSYFSSGPESENYPKWRSITLALANKLKPFGAEINMEALDAGDYYRVFPSSEVVLTAEQYVDLMVTGAELTDVAPVNNPALNAGENFSNVIDKMNEVLAMETSHGTYNTKCDVHMPGQALSMYNDTQLMEDACTGALQEQLNKGWRIIAACPQPDQRRPDYILGRFNPGEV